MYPYPWRGGNAGTDKVCRILPLKSGVWFPFSLRWSWWWWCAGWGFSILYEKVAAIKEKLGTGGLGMDQKKLQKLFPPIRAGFTG